MASTRSDESLQRWLDQPSFDPTLWVIAWDGDEVAGGVINAIHPTENESLGVSRGWLHSVFTRRPWRKRGLANALIARSLLAIKERGMDYGVLGVDADNPTVALGLYERIGFVVAERSTAWRKPFEAERGEDSMAVERYGWDRAGRGALRGQCPVTGTNPAACWSSIAAATSWHGRRRPGRPGLRPLPA